MRILTAIALSTLFATSSFAAAGGTSKTQSRTSSVRRISEDAKPSETKPAEGGEAKPVKKTSKKKAPKKSTEAPAAETPAK